MKKILFYLSVFVLFCGLNSASATVTAYWEITHTWPSDLVITIGAGDTGSPLWSSVVQSHEWDFSDTVDITAGESYLYGNTWWVQMNDQWGWDSGNITAFSITDSFGTVFTSTDTPVSIPDLSTRYAYIDVPNNPIPEPATVFLFGLGILGLAGVGRKKFIK